MSCGLRRDGGAGLDGRTGMLPRLHRLTGRHRRHRLSCHAALGDRACLGRMDLRHTGCRDRCSLRRNLLNGNPGRLRLRALADGPSATPRRHARGMRLRRSVVIGLAVRHGIVPTVVDEGVTGTTLAGNLSVSSSGNTRNTRNTWSPRNDPWHLPLNLRLTRHLTRHLTWYSPSRPRCPSRSRSLGRPVRVRRRQGEHRTGPGLLRRGPLRRGGQRTPAPPGRLPTVLDIAGTVGTLGMRDGSRVGSLRLRRTTGGQRGQPRRQRVLFATSAQGKLPLGRGHTLRRHGPAEPVARRRRSRPHARRP